MRQLPFITMQINENNHDDYVWLIDSKTYVYASTSMEEIAAWLSQLLFCNARFNVTTPPGAEKMHLQPDADLLGHRIELYEPEDWSTPCLRISPAPWLFGLFTPDEKARVKTFCVRDYLRFFLRGHSWLTVASDLTGEAESG